MSVCFRYDIITLIYKTLIVVHPTDSEKLGTSFFYISMI